MNKTLALLLPLLVASLAGCLNNGTEDTWTPRDQVPYVVPETVEGMEFYANIENRSVQGIWIEDRIAYLSGGAGLRILDVADPQDPVALANDVPATRSRDVDLIHHTDGNLYAVLATGGNVTLVDVTDPTEPSLVSSVGSGIGQAHNVHVVPGTAIVYVSNSISRDTEGDLASGAVGGFDILDFNDPLSPTVTTHHFPPFAMTVTGVPVPIAAVSCHDVTFTIERDLAYCAALTQTYIMDISDPLAPIIVQVISAETNTLFHSAIPAHGGDLLILGDEFDGVLVGSPACADAAGEGLPTAGLWFYDISDLATPTPLGYFGAPYDALGASAANITTQQSEGGRVYCSAHFGQVVDDRDLLAIAWYEIGTFLLDFSDPADVRIVSHFLPASPYPNTWDAWYDNGHVFTGDTVRGMDILRLV